MTTIKHEQFYAESVKEDFYEIMGKQRKASYLLIQAIKADPPSMVKTSLIQWSENLSSTYLQGIIKGTVVHYMNVQ